MTVTRRGLAGCEHSVLPYISAAPQLLNMTTVWRLVIQSPSSVFLSLFAVCQAPSAEYTPGCLLTQRSGIYSHNAVCMCVCAFRTNLCLVGDNSLCICLCIIVVLWPQSLHDAGVSCLMRPVAGRFCAAVMKRLLPHSCLLFTQMWTGGVICNMTEICFVWREDSMIARLSKTNRRVGRQLFPEQTDLYKNI